MSIITTINPKFNFWELYPDLRIAFKSVEDKYKKKSSDVMWFIFFVWDIGPDNRFKNLEYDDRAKILSKDLLNDEKFFINDRQFLEEQGNIWIKLNDTPAKRHLRQWVETLEKRTKFLKSADYDLETFEKLDKMAVGTMAIFKTFNEINKDINKEDGSGVTKGGHVPSLADNEDL